MTIFGDGPDQTVIDVYPKIVSFPYSVIWWNSSDLHVTVRGLKVLGPTGTDKAYPNQTPDCGFLKGNIGEPDSSNNWISVDNYGSDNRISVDDLVVTGKFVHVISTVAGNACGAPEFIPPLMA